MTTPVTSLVTLDDVREHLNIDDTSQDSELQGFVDAATVYIQNVTGPIIGQTFTETYSGGGPTICLQNPPVAAIVSVTEYVGATGYTLTQVNLGDPTGSYSFSLDSAASGILRRRYNSGLSGSFAGGDHNIQVVYVAGLAAVPGDIRMATLEDIRGLFTQTQYGSPATEFGGGAGSDNHDQWGSDRNNPTGAFPRLAALLSGPVARTPSIG